MGRIQKKNTEAQFARFFQPIIVALRELGGSGRPAEVKELLLQKMKLSEQYLRELNKSGESKFSNQVDWARFYLVRGGYLDASTRGVWSLTEKGRNTEIDGTRGAEIIRDVASAFRTPKAGKEAQEAATAYAETSFFDASVSNYRADVLEIIRQLPPEGFERLCQRLLREAGFEQVQVTGRTGDGGIDGHGVLQLNPFVSFRVLFQCKRYAGSVGPEKVRDFRGAMAGRTDKGIILTTGSFTQLAATEAARDGVPPIELVDSDGLINLLEELKLGLRPKQTFEIDQAFFDQFSRQLSHAASWVGNLRSDIFDAIIMMRAGEPRTSRFLP